MVELDDEEGHVVAKPCRSQVVRRGAAESAVVTCPFWAVMPGQGPTPFEVSMATVPFIQVKCPSTQYRMIMCHVDELGQL